VLFSSFGFRICFGFRHSDFGFAPPPRYDPSARFQPAKYSSISSQPHQHLARLGPAHRVERARAVSLDRIPAHAWSALVTQKIVGLRHNPAPTVLGCLEERVNRPKPREARDEWK
jgi:hypothetical protein